MTVTVTGQFADDSYVPDGPGPDHPPAPARGRRHRGQPPLGHRHRHRAPAAALRHRPLDRDPGDRPERGGTRAGRQRGLTAPDQAARSGVRAPGRALIPHPTTTGERPMTNLPPVPLTRSGHRARAAAIVAAAARITPVEAFRLMDTVDAVAAAVLTDRRAGRDDHPPGADRPVAAADPHSTRPTRPVHGLRVSDVEWTFVRELGTRIQAVRTARRLGLPAVTRVTGIPYQQLLDAERGTAILSVLGVYRVAEALRGPAGRPAHRPGTARAATAPRRPHAGRRPEPVPVLTRRGVSGAGPRLVRTLWPALTKPRR